MRGGRIGTAALGSAIFVLAAASARADEPSPCNTSAGDRGEIAAVVRAFYEAERTGDAARWRALTTPDFYVFHEGVVTPPDVFARWIVREHTALGRDRQSYWTIETRDLKVSLDCRTALTTQVVRSTSAAPTLKPGPPYDEGFLESFWLRKTTDAGWRIAFWNVATVPKVLPKWAKP